MNTLILILITMFSAIPSGSNPELVSLSQDSIKAETPLDLARAYQQRGDQKRALEIYMKVLEKNRNAFEPGILIPVYNNIGVIFQEQGQLAQALEYHLMALEAAEKAKDLRGLAASANNLGIVHYRSGDRGKALEYFRFSLQKKEELNDRSGMINSLNNIGSLFQEGGQADSALSYYLRSLEMEGSEDNTGQTLNNIGRLFLDKKETDKALDYFAKALDRASRSGNERMKASVLDNMGLLFVYEEDYKKALQLFDSALYLAEAADDPEGARLSNYHLSELYASAGQYKEAYEHFRHYERLAGQFLEDRNKVLATEALYVKAQKQEQINKLLLVTALLMVMLVIIIAIVFIQRQKQKHRLAMALADQRQLRFSQVLEAQESERKRIAGDLHDSIGQLLSVVKLSMSDLEDTLEFKNEEQREQLRKALEILDETSTEVRKISHNLMPSALIRSGFLAAIRELADRTNNSQKLELKLDTGNFPDRLPEQKEFGLYRIIQELVSNILRHSGADKASITMRQSHGALQITVKDNGTGIDKDSIESSPGIGWKNIYSRAESLNAEIRIEEALKEGSIIVISMSDENS